MSHVLILVYLATQLVQSTLFLPLFSNDADSELEGRQKVRESFILLTQVRHITDALVLGGLAVVLASTLDLDNAPNSQKEAVDEAGYDEELAVATVGAP